MNAAPIHEHPPAPKGLSVELSDDEAVANAELYDRHISRYMLTGLGRPAITRAFHLNQEAIGSTREDDAVRLPVQEILDARQKLEALSPEGKQKFNDILETHRMPEWLNELIGADEQDVRDADFDLSSPIVTKLIQKNAAGDYTVGDNTLLHFLQMHNFNLAEAQKKLDTQLPGLKSRFMKRLSEAIHNGSLPPIALERYEAIVDKTLVVVDDGMTTRCEGTLAYQDPIDRPDVVSLIAFDPLATGKQLESSYTHETLHSLSKTRAGKTAGIEGMFGNERTIGGSLINEAVTEHLSRFLLGDVSQTPEEHHTEVGAYVSPRRLLHKIINYGQKTIPFDMFVNAYFEDESAHELRDAIVDSFDGFDIIAAIAAVKTETDITDLEGKLAVYKKTRLARKAIRAVRKPRRKV
ncbi:hypothetical protein EOL96_03595 [Candidatus Saccharibacteria bacterium]|nr:hypothetical protein [Candidatus Saccharibacteria bacterium]